jgi:hypothetical protein
VPLSNLTSSAPTTSSPYFARIPGSQFHVSVPSQRSFQKPLQVRGTTCNLVVHLRWMSLWYLIVQNQGLRTPPPPCRQWRHVTKIRIATSSAKNTLVQVLWSTESG